MTQGLDTTARKTLFTDARTHHKWLDKPVPDALLQEIYDLAKMGPTSANCCPARFIFVRSKEGKDRLKDALDRGNVDQTMAAPVTVIIGHDMRFYEHLDFLCPAIPNVRSWFEGNDKTIQDTAFRNSSLQGAYLMLAARTCGLDCGPMSGFNNDKVDEIFFKGTTYKSNFLCNLGYGDINQVYPRAPRFAFEKVASIV